MSVPINGENLLKYLEKNKGRTITKRDPDDLTISFNPNIRVYNYDMISEWTTRLTFQNQWVNEL